MIGENSLGGFAAVGHIGINAAHGESFFPPVDDQGDFIADLFTQLSRRSSPKGQFHLGSRRPVHRHIAGGRPNGSPSSTLIRSSDPSASLTGKVLVISTT